MVCGLMGVSKESHEGDLKNLGWPSRVGSPTGFGIWQEKSMPLTGEVSTLTALG